MARPIDPQRNTSEPRRRRRRGPRVPLALLIIILLLLALLFGGGRLGLFDGMSFMPAYFRSPQATERIGERTSEPAGSTEAVGVTSTTSSAGQTESAPQLTTIRVSGRELYLDDVALSLADLEKRLDEMPTGSSLRVIDDGAVKADYEAVLAALDARQLNYSIGEP